MVAAGIFAQPANPYRRLLQRIGCQPGDLERLVAAEGLVGTLQTLFRQGVYLSVDELKGRPVVRGSTSFAVDATLLRNPRTTTHLRGRSGGTGCSSRPYPARFGGGPTHYQLVEEERLGGQPSRCLLIHPALGPLDPAAIRDAFLDAIGAASSAERMMSQIWREGQVLRVERTPPDVTATGEIQHLHLHLARPVSASR